MVVEPKESFDLQDAIRAGLRDCVEYLGSSSTSFALPAIRKWARLMTDNNNSKGWPTVFNNGIGLYGTLRTMYEGIEHTKELLDRRAAINLENGSDGLDEITPINNELHELKKDLDPNSPLNESETGKLFERIQSHLVGIYKAEKDALETLKIVVTEFE